jgi:hypothetical protein
MQTHLNTRTHAHTMEKIQTEADAVTAFLSKIIREIYKHNTFFIYINIWEWRTKNPQCPYIGKKEASGGPEFL